MNSRNRGHRIKARPLSRAQIIRSAEELSKQYARSVEPELALLGISFDAVYEHIIYPEYEIALIENQL